MIKGPSVLKGKVLISGSKNAALPILASTLLFDKPVVIQNLPRVRDINTMLNLLRSLGSKIEFFDNRKKVRISKTKKPKHFASYATSIHVLHFINLCNKVSRLRERAGSGRSNKFFE